MAKLINEGNSAELEDGSKITETAQDLGIDFGCENGVCGACEIEVLSGAENLSGLSEAEENYGVSGNARLACQCKINSGTVEISQ